MDLTSKIATKRTEILHARSGLHQLHEELQALTVEFQQEQDEERINYAEECLKEIAGINPEHTYEIIDEFLSVLDELPEAIPFLNPDGYKRVHMVFNLSNAPTVAVQSLVQHLITTGVLTKFVSKYYHKYQFKIEHVGLHPTYPLHQVLVRLKARRAT